MTSILQFLNDLWENHRIKDQDPEKKEMQRDRELYYNIIKDIPDLLNPDPLYGGSYKKRTMIKDSYDLDLVIYYPSSTQFSVENIYNSVLKYLKKKIEYTVIQKNVAVRILKRGNYHIDIVPAKRISNTDNDAYLWKSKFNPPMRMKTNIEKQRSAISEFGNRELIILLKLWRFKNKIEFPSFVLEQITMKALENESNLKLNEQFEKVLDFISENITSIKLSDPANENNEITKEDVISSYEKIEIKKCAEKSLKNDLDTIQGWKNLFTLGGNNFSSNRRKKPRLSPDSPGTRFA